MAESERPEPDQPGAAGAPAGPGPHAERWPPARIAWRVVTVLTFVYAIAFVHRIGISLLVEPMQADLGLSDTAIGLLAGILFALPYTLGGPLFGWLVDRGRRRAIIATASVAWSATTAAFGMFTSFAALASSRIAAGLTQSALQPAAASMIADCFPAADRSRAYGVYVAGTAIGTSLAYWLGAIALGVGAVVANALGVAEWSAAFLALAVIGLLAPLAMLLVREPERHERSAAGQVSVRETAAYVRRERVAIGTLSFGVAICFLAPYGQLAFMPVMFAREYGWSAAELAVAFGTVAVIVGGLGSVSAGWVSSRLAARGMADSDWFVCLVGAVATLLAGAAAPLMPSGEWSLAMFALSGVFTNWPSVGALGVIARIGPNEMRGQLTALYTSTVGLIGAGLGPVAVGALSDGLTEERGGVAAALSITFLTCAIVSGVLLASGRRAFARIVARTG